MQIGELFVSLGVKGAEKTVGAISSTATGLSKMGSVSLEAKAAILGAFYALERLVSASGKVGTGLTQFNALTGESTKTLQQYQYAARQVGVSNEDVTGTFKGLQAVVTDIRTGQGVPQGLSRIAGTVGGFSQKDLKDYEEHPEKLIQKLQQYAKLEKDIGVRNKNLKSFGLNEGMIAAVSQQAFTPSTLNKAPTYSDKEIGQLNKANIAWANLGNKIEMSVGHFNAKFGGQLISDISKLVPKVLLLVEAFAKLADKIKIFEGIGKIFEGWTKLFDLLSSEVSSVSEKATGGKGQKEKQSPVEQGKSLLGFLTSTDETGFLRSSFKSLEDSIGTKAPALAAQKVPKAAPFSPQKNPTLGALASQKVNPISPVPPSVKISNHVVNQPAQKSSVEHTHNNNTAVHQHFAHAGTDHRKIADSTKKAVNQAHKQSYALSQSS